MPLVLSLRFLVSVLVADDVYKRRGREGIKGDEVTMINNDLTMVKSGFILQRLSRNPCIYIYIF